MYYLIADATNHRIRRVDASSGMIDTVAGAGPTGYNFPAMSGNSYGIAYGGGPTTIIGGGYRGDGGLAIHAQLSFPRGVKLDRAGNLLIADYRNHRIRRIDAIRGIISTIAGTGDFRYNRDGILAINASLSSPQSLALDASGNLFIADYGNKRIRRVDASSGIISTVAGTGQVGYSGDGGPATHAQLDSPADIALDW